MAHKPPTTFTPAVRGTLDWLVERRWIDAPLDAAGEAQYLLCHAVRLHESFSRLPAARGGGRCLVVGSWGLEVPYLAGRLGWRDVVCICAPGSMSSLMRPVRADPRPGRGDLRPAVRAHPNRDERYAFHLLEHDLESGPMPFDDGAFDLVVFWGCFEHLRHDPEFGLYEINRVTAPGGVVSLVTDNAISFQMTHAMLRGQPMPTRLHHPASEGHWRLYTPPEIEELLTGTGWRVDLLTTIVLDPPVYWKWWKRWLFQRLVAGFRRGFGLREPYWNAFILAQAVKSSPPARQYPRWLYKDDKIAALKREMLEIVGARARASA